VHVGQIQVEADDVVIIQLAEIEAFFAKIGRVDIETFGREHQFNGFRRRWLIFDQQHAHRENPFCNPVVCQSFSTATHFINQTTNEGKRLISA
jgi:hypothetical protein